MMNVTATKMRRLASDLRGCASLASSTRLFRGESRTVLARCAGWWKESSAKDLKCYRKATHRPPTPGHMGLYGTRGL